jgi:hypothetical protein
MAGRARVPRVRDERVGRNSQDRSGWSTLPIFTRLAAIGLRSSSGLGPDRLPRAFYPPRIAHYARADSICARPEQAARAATRLRSITRDEAKVPSLAWKAETPPVGRGRRQPPHDEVLPRVGEARGG